MEPNIEWFKLGPCFGFLDQQHLQFFSVRAQLLLQIWCMLSGFPHSRHLQTTPMVCTDYQGVIATGAVWLVSYL